MSIDMTRGNIQKIPHNLLVKVQAVYDNLKTAEKKVADLLLLDPDFFAAATIVEASQKAGCSEATFTRLSKRLGYKGYPELKDALIQQTDEENPLPYQSIKMDDSCETVTAKVFEAAIQSIRDTLNVLDIGSYSKAVETLVGAEKIMFCGAGDAFAVAMSGFQKFLRVGLNALVSADLDVNLITASRLGPNDAVIAISHSGRTKSVVDVIKTARLNGAKVISITNFPVSPLAKNSDIVLLTAAFAEHAQGEIMTKRIAELCVLESIYINVMRQSSPDLNYQLKTSNDALELNKLH